MPKHQTGSAGEHEKALRRLGELERENARLRRALELGAASRDVLKRAGSAPSSGHETCLQHAIKAAGLSVWAYDPKTGEVLNLAGGLGCADAPPEQRYTLDQALTLWHPEDREAVARSLQASLRTGEPLVLEARLLAADGSELWVVARGRPVSDAAGAPARLLWVLEDITDRRQAEEEHALFLDKLSHRIKNTLVLIQATAWQTGLRATDVNGFLELFDGRLRAIAVAHDVLTLGGVPRASLTALVRAVLAEHEERLTRRITVEVEELPLTSTMVPHLALVLHELTMNATKHGALSVPGGSVALTGQVCGEDFVLTWREAGGPEVAAPTAHGFGTMLLERVVARRYGGRATFDWHPAGLVCTLSLPIAKVRG